MCLRFVFLLITLPAAWLRLSRREEAWKIAEIMILRHQVAVLRRRQPRRPKLNWADRALLATLLSVIPSWPASGLSRSVDRLGDPQGQRHPGDPGGRRTKDNPADPINVGLEELVKSNCHLRGIDLGPP